MNYDIRHLYKLHQNFDSFEKHKDVFDIKRMLQKVMLNDCRFDMTTTAYWDVFVYEDKNTLLFMKIFVRKRQVSPKVEFGARSTKFMIC